MFELKSMMGKLQPDRLILLPTFNDLSVSRNLFLKAKLRHFCASENETNVYVTVGKRGAKLFDNKRYLKS